jgi:hypothetical protein
VEFWEEICFPSSVLGPVDFWALARLAARRRSEICDWEAAGAGMGNSDLRFEISEEETIEEAVDMSPPLVWGTVG